MVDRPHLGQRIGVGRTADVHAWGDGAVIKLVRPGFPDAIGEEEALAEDVEGEATHLRVLIEREL